MRSGASANLTVLLRERYRFLGEHARPGDRVLEIGAGIGISADYLPEVTLYRTDVELNPWIDVLANGESLPFADASIDVVICIAALHHMDYPMAAIREMARVLRPNGNALIMEVHASWLLRLMLFITRHEYVDRRIDPFGPLSCQTRSGDHWNGNNAVGDRLFLDGDKFAASAPQFELVLHRFTEALLFVNSGGVNEKVPYIPLPGFALEYVSRLDRILCRYAPDIFAICQEIVLRRR